MNSTELESNTENRRHESRTRIAALEATIRKQGLLPGKGFTVCQTIDIDRGGIAVTSSTLILKTGDKITLNLKYGDQQFIINGIIGYHYYHHNSINQYGIIFIHVPYEFDVLLDALLEDGEQASASGTPSNKEQNNTLPGLKLVKGTQRRAEKRTHVPNLAVRAARKTHFHKPVFVPCRLIDIGRGGIGFMADSLDQPLSSRIELELRYQQHQYQLVSLVSFYQPGARGIRYGVEFLAVPPKLARLIDGFLPG